VYICLASKYLLAYDEAMKKTDKQKQTRKPTEVRRQEIIDAAMQILATDGARQFTADRLGTAVGLASGSIFRHFGSMEEILDGIVGRIEEIIFADFPPSADDPLERLRMFFEARVRAISEHPEVSKLLLTSTLIPNGSKNDRGKRLSQFKVRSRGFVIDCLRRAKADDLLAGDISHEESSILVFGVLYAVGHMGISTRSGEDRGELVKRIWRLLERSLTGRH